MPHSSGGGSHSGGSHSGSGFSGSSSSSGGSSAKHIKHTSFPGARRYVYYENYRPVYVYADYAIYFDRHSGICVSARLPYDRHKSKGEKICQSKALF